MSKILVAAMAMSTSICAVPDARADLVPECPAHVYLGNQPGGTESPDWSEQAQGVANDGRHWFFTHNDLGDRAKSSLMKYDKNWRPADGTDVGRMATANFPAILSERGINHFGDPDYYGGYVFVPFEGDGLLRAVIAAFRASNLEFVDWVDVAAYQQKASWVAINSVEHMLYTSTDRIIAGTPLLRYALDVSKIDNGIQGDFLAPAAPVGILDSDGGAVVGKFIYVQGGVFTPWGDLYLVAGKAGESVADTRGGIHLFRRTPDGSAFQLIQSAINWGASAGTPVFAYEYHPGSTGLGEEPEGIDWWNQDNDPDARYSGQLHAVLLDNQVDDDQIWLKHYRVDYFCIRDEDSDGDGISDGEEVYARNTNPLLLDSDSDALEDTLDNCPSAANADQADLDADGIGDACDSDVDGDGQVNADEQSCGSNPDDFASVSADFDDDGVPDCVDEDDDRDGVADESDICPGTILPDPLIPTSGKLRNNRYSLVDNDIVFDGNKVGKGRMDHYSTTDTRGCNATQIANAMGLGKSHYEYGITAGVLRAWIAQEP